MPASVTLGQMKTRARSLSNMETSSSTSFVTDTELTQWLNDGIKTLYDKLIHARGEDYYCKETSPITLVPGTANYALPTDFYQLIEVVCTDGTNNFRVLRFQRGETADVLNAQSGYFGPSIITDMRFRIGPTYLEFRPTPATVGWSYILYYVPIFSELVADIDTFDGINGWEDYAVLWAAIRAMAKEESDTSALAAQLAVVDARIGKMAPNRDQSQTRRVADTRQDSVSVWTRRRARGWW